MRFGRARRAAGALVVLAVAACGEHLVDAPAASVTVDAIGGRYERGDTARVVLHTRSDSSSGAALALTVQPSDAATVLADGRLIFRRSGNLTVTARSADGTVAATTIIVTAPPSIVFDMEVAGNRDVYRVALDGGDLARLTTAALDDVDPTSAAGSVVFTSYRDGEAELYAIGAGTERRLTSTADNETAPALRADGQRIAFVREASGVDRIWVSSADGTGAARLTTDAAGGGQPEGSPTWTADGRITFTSTASGQADLATATDAPPAVAVPIAAANTPAAEVEGAWSSDGRKLAFVSTRAGDAALYVLDAASSAVTRLTPVGVNAGQPAWLADGRLVYVVERAGGSVLQWLDPAHPSSPRDVPVTGLAPHRPAASR